ncbi:aminotransferase class I/II-fold pyridoxal phosphate-dependent enzyme [Sphingomonas sp. ac-8]|uniref:aminotransferase class I/II-fold pyridoxal phosphate-dependent enzyme n=1 Tax=Sphingomonas sp. ac-8 TaxID=3242977 RepID=UPI003A8129DA
MDAGTEEVEALALRALMVHGGDLDEAARCFPDAPRPWLDLSTGINPVAWEPAAMPDIDLRALPSAAARAALEAAAAQAFGAETVAITALPGSELGLRLLAGLGLPAPVRVVTPGYRTHGEALPGAAAIPAEAIDTVADGTLLLANPNNPDGRLLAPERLLAIARRLGERGGVLVVDEAFADSVPDASLLPHLTTGDRVLVFRSFGKFFGLAGVRLGFACGAPDLVATLRDRLGSWPVSAAALAIGTAAYRDAAWIEAARRDLAGRCAALDRVLRAHGLTPLGACPLFRLIETADAGILFAMLARHGILTRPFDYAPRWLRLGVPANAAALDRLDRALSDR